MSITKETTVSQITINESGAVHVRYAVTIFENGAVIGQSYHRHVICPGDDYSSEVEQVKAVCAATHTQEVVAKYLASLEANKPPMFVGDASTLPSREQ